MKTSAYIGIMLAASLLLGCATTQTMEVSKAPLLHNRVVLTVHGLSCPLCSNNLDGQLQRIESVENVEINLKTGAVTVGLADGHAVTEKQLADAVKAAGFTLAEIQPAGNEQ